ncbi:MAG: hypothetical protein IJW59_04130 [Clostridia bacterium]|nr:hypothetical protein [Clostridia bacterium]
MKRIIILFYFLFIIFMFMFGNEKEFENNITKICAESDFEYYEDCVCVSLSSRDLLPLIDVLSIDIVDSFFVDDRIVLEGYTSNLKNSVCVNYKKINIQIMVCEDVCIVGYPLIKKSF